MPMKPRKGESQSAFMSRCMSETYGADAPEERTQEQAVAICMDYWRAARGGKKPKQSEVEVQRIIRVWQMLLSEKQYPEPDEDEDHQDFIDRCVEEVQADDDAVEDADAEELCEVQWADAQPFDEEDEERSGNGIIKRTHSEQIREGTSFVLSDENIDRMGEVITAAGWQLDSFRKNPVALFNHNPNQPIGRWHDLAIKDGKLQGHLELAPKGTSARIDEIRALVEAGILRAVSVGFRSLKKEPLDERADSMFGPFRYLKQELVECSLVSVPANPNALAIAKGLNISPATIDVIFAGPGKEDRIHRRGVNGGSARTHGNKRRGDMSLAQRIQDLQTQIVAKRDALATHIEQIDDSNVSDADLEKTNTLNSDIGRLEKAHAGLVESEKNLAASLDKNGGGKPRLPAVVTPGASNGKAGEHLVSTIGKKDLNLLDYIVRAGTVAYVAKTWGKSYDETRQRIYGDNDNDLTKTFVELIHRAASAPAMTTVTGWAAELVQQTWTAMMPTLMPAGILTRLAGRGLSLSFGRAGRINIPTRSRTPSVAGSFVGEGLAIPVRQGAFTTQALTPKKMAVITVWTREMDEHSIPAIEGVLREAIQTDTTVAVDSVLIDAGAATVIRPAGLLNGVSAQTPTAITGGSMDALVKDLKNLIGALTTSTFGNIRTPVLLMNPTDVLGAALVNAPNTGVFPFKEEVGRGTLLNIPIIDSSTVTAKTVILIDAADFVVADGGAPRMELNDSATLHMEDTNPADLVGGSPAVTASPQRSLFQTDSIALRMIWPINWLQRRPGTIAYVQNVTWS